jgi:D-glycero-D-manno-heptose 1,7-bisphosphate phosphatase
VVKSDQKFVFLDRDGVINRDSPNYIKSWAEFEFLPGSQKAITRLTQAGFTIILITNQSAVNRKMISRADLDHIHRCMKDACQILGGHISDIFFCPHTPDERCACRKPKPGLIFQAGEKYNIDIRNSVMIGDSAKDIECARNAGCRQAILVRTGNIVKARRQLAEKNIQPDYIADDLFEAALQIIEHD